MRSPAHQLITVLLVVALGAGAFALRTSAEGADGATSQAGPARGAAYANTECGPDVLKTPAQLHGNEARDLTLCLLNYERAKQGLGVLESDYLLQRAADLHSEDMVARDYFEHDTPEGTTPQDRIAQQLYNPTQGWTGENIAWGEGSEGSMAALMDRWMHSPGHKENILRPGFTEVGVGLAWGGPGAKPGHARAITVTTNFGG